MPAAWPHLSSIILSCVHAAAAQPSQLDMHGTLSCTGQSSQLCCVAGRVLVGLGVGLASCVAPVFISECAPSDVRAALVIGNVFMITFGQFSAYLSDYLFAGVPGTWRYRLLSCQL